MSLNDLLNLKCLVGGIITYLNLLLLLMAEIPEGFVVVTENCILPTVNLKSQKFKNPDTTIVVANCLTLFPSPLNLQ